MLTLTEVTKRYGDRLAVDAVTLTLKPGEIYGLLGPNGAGKTTLINLICHLLVPEQGRIEWQGQPIAQVARRVIGVAPQGQLLYPSLSGREHLQFFGRLYGLGRSQRRQRVATCLELVGLTEVATQPVQGLSGGMKQRLNLAIALIHRPQLLILDEPTVGLDFAARQRLWATVQTLQAEGMTILLTTHLLHEAERYCDRVGILQQGRLVTSGTLDELRQRSGAQTIVRLYPSDRAAAAHYCQTLGYHYHETPREFLVWLPDDPDFSTLCDRFSGLALEGLHREAIGLEHLYQEWVKPSPEA
ncbi:ABC transporter ATP-binding protein [Spirulina major CS-329]|uniref:ABC transporter ATP-binding protein n=1 Tax=Spirulina TaxID=1154 RepID=UPI00232ED428|nr:MULTISPECIES: ABC transporter ATP-binding protein [Spirulina]MDB9493918.1 ABC transporter ATP-binding protein [Spirulina subsalsa CS-330]MDB9501668.1 ABC transporter ATP-binding protein [Spirulina major CS-329]